MAIEHDSIADGERHEPKGIDGASANQVYVANGAGSGAWMDTAASTLAAASNKQIIVANGSGGSTAQNSVRMGWQDFNDTATASTPITLSSAGTFFNMTNNGLGANTNLAYKIPGNRDIWNTGINRFDFTDLALGDTVLMRIDLEFTTNGTNHEIVARIRLAEGHASQYNLNMFRRNYKSAGTYRETFLFWVYMGDSPTRDNPAVIQVSSDTGTTNTVRVHGWAVQSMTRSNY